MTETTAIGFLVLGLIAITFGVLGLVFDLCLHPGEDKRRLNDEKDKSDK